MSAAIDQSVVELKYNEEVLFLGAVMSKKGWKPWCDQSEELGFYQLPRIQEFFSKTQNPGQLHSDNTEQTRVNAVFRAELHDASVDL